MNLKHVQLLTTWTIPERCKGCQLSRFTNLDDDYVYLITIFGIRIIYGSIQVIDISESLFVISIGIETNESKNFTVLSSMISMDEIVEFLVIWINFVKVFMNIPKEHCNIVQTFKYLHILPIIINI